MLELIRIQDLVEPPQKRRMIGRDIWKFSKGGQAKINLGDLANLNICESVSTYGYQRGEEAAFVLVAKSA